MSNSVGNTSTKRSSGALNTRSVVLAVGELRVSRSLRMMLTELLELIDRKIESSKVQPRIKEHTSMSSRQDETITVHPGKVLGVVGHLRSVQDSTNLSTSKRKTHVTRVSSGNGVHGQTTSFIGSSLKCGLGIHTELSAHLQGSALSSKGKWLSSIVESESIGRSNNGSEYGKSRELHLETRDFW
jgi:hypothetical protein